MLASILFDIYSWLDFSNSKMDNTQELHKLRIKRGNLKLCLTTFNKFIDKSISYIEEIN